LVRATAQLRFRERYRTAGGGLESRRFSVTALPIKMPKGVQDSTPNRFGRVLGGSFGSALGMRSSVAPDMGLTSPRQLLDQYR